MERAEKEQEIKYLTECFTKAHVALCTDYMGLTVAEVTELRRNLRHSGAIARVVKNTLARRSAKQAWSAVPGEQLEKFLSNFDGPCLLVFAEKDPVTPTKVISNFIKDKKKLRVKGGWLDGKYLDPKGVEMLAQMPSREEILAKLLALINTPATQLLRLMNAPGSQVARVVEAQRVKLEQAGK